MVIIIIIIIIIIIRMLLTTGQLRCLFPRAIPLVMMPWEKQLTGFYEHGSPLGSPSGRRRSA